MWISNTSIKRPVFATMFVLSFVVLGLVALTRLGIDLFPSLDFPFVNITTVYPGASPEEALKLGWAHGALLTTFPGDVSMARLEEVEAFAKGGSARVQR